MSEKDKLNRYSELDVFRGLAILSILLFHYTTRYNQIYGHVEMPFAFPYGYLGVQLFYMISGFVIYMSLENINNGTDFLINRFTRLYPAYWAAIVITFVIVAIFTLPEREAPFSDALINLSMLQDWIGGVKYVDGAYWALSRFVSFYLIVFLIYKFNLKQRIVPLCIFWLFIICISKIMSDVGFSIPHRVKLTLLLIEGSFFIIGVMFYMIKKYGNKLSFYFVIFCCQGTIYFVNGKLIFVAAFIFTFLFFLFSIEYLKFINLRALEWLGGISYSLYLVHQNVGYIVINKLKDYNINFSLLIIIPMAISLAIASFMTYYIEKPSLTLLRSKTNELLHRSAKNRAR